MLAALDDARAEPYAAARPDCVDDHTYGPVRQRIVGEFAVVGQINAIARVRRAEVQQQLPAGEWRVGIDDLLDELRAGGRSRRAVTGLPPASLTSTRSYP